jgi:cobalt/nickel transport system ATP-binding protein
VDLGDDHPDDCVDVRAAGAGDEVSALEVRDLRFTYPDGTDVLRGVDLKIETGERVALLGPNGAGKTTLVLHLIGILRAKSGSVFVDGVELTDQTVRGLRSRVGFVFQDPDDQLFMPTVRQDVAFGPANFGVKGDELELRVKDALTMVGMESAADKAPHHLSGGERRRVAIATVLAMQPSVLILDEPSSNLDPAGRRELAEILADLDVTLLMVTHDLPYAFEVCPRSVVMSGGVIAADGPTVDVLADTESMSRHRLELPAGFHPHHL